MRIDMKYRSLFAVLISIGILFSLLSCMKRSPVRIYDKSRISPAEAARISIPADIRVESVDGQRVRSLTDYVLSTIDEIHVAPGEHEIVVRYSSIWAHNKRKHEEINSEDIALKFKAERGGLYKLTHPGLDDMMEAQKFAENPDIRIEKIGNLSSTENEVTTVSRPVEMIPDKPQIEKPSTVKDDTALKEEWYRMNEKEKEEFRKWMEWNKMTEEEKEKFREWKDKSGKE
jgi:hypothetical protein